MFYNDFDLFKFFGSGFIISFIHAYIPTHWNAVTNFSSKRGISRWGTALATSVISLSHILATLFLEVFIVVLGYEIDKSVGHILFILAGGFLLFWGTFYFLLQLDHLEHIWYGDRMSQSDRRDECQTATEPETQNTKYLNFALLVAMGGYPCLTMIPVSIGSVSHGWSGLLHINVGFLLGTIGGSVIFTQLTLFNWKQLNSVHQFLFKFEFSLIGLILIALGTSVMFVEGAHG